jgi:hypothetical protein
MSKSIVDLANSYQQAGDESSRQAALNIALNLGRQYSQGGAGEPLISQLVGVAIERNALGAMDPNGALGDNGELVKDRLDQLVQQRNAIRDLGKQADAYWEKMSDQDWVSYYSRSASFGEMNALRWVIGKYGQQ